jgi:hypothetical protein
MPQITEVQGKELTEEQIALVLTAIGNTGLENSFDPRTPHYPIEGHPVSGVPNVVMLFKPSTALLSEVLRINRSIR